MRILTISDAAWDDKNSLGNTYSNFFSDWTESEFYHIYFREANPRNTVCRSYYRITDKMLLKNIFTPSKIGQEFDYVADEGMVTSSETSEKRFISAIHKFNFKFAYSAEWALWKLKGWQNNKLAEYVRKSNPDIIFSFAIDKTSVFLLLKYLKENTNAKLVLFIADDVYGKYISGRVKASKGKMLRDEFALADKIYGISEDICRVYGKEFSKEIELLQKGCSFDDIKEKPAGPFKITYAGNLLYGRLNTLSTLADAIDKINKSCGEQKYRMEIYSGTVISDEDKAKINIDGASVFCGEKPYNEIVEILRESHIVLHVESFEYRQIECVRYSFSTKITDCLQSGSVLMVIGPQGITSVEYPRKIPGTIVIDNVSDIEDTLRDIKDADMAERAVLIRAFALENHSHDVIRTRLQSDFTELVAYERYDKRIRR